MKIICAYPLENGFEFRGNFTANVRFTSGEGVIFTKQGESIEVFDDVMALGENLPAYLKDVPQINHRDISPDDRFFIPIWNGNMFVEVFPYEYFRKSTDIANDVLYSIRYLLRDLRSIILPLINPEKMDALKHLVAKEIEELERSPEMRNVYSLILGVSEDELMQMVSIFK